MKTMTTEMKNVIGDLNDKGEGHLQESQQEDKDGRYKTIKIRRSN